MGIRIIAVLFLCAACECVSGQDGSAKNLLPPPTGPYSVGRVSYHWIDSARPEPLASIAGAYRELMVDIWYPAQTSGAHPPAPYIPDLPAVEKVVGEGGMRKAFGNAYTQLHNGRLFTHAQENADFVRGLGERPVLIFSHGLGLLRTDYTAQLEEFASYGYVVASIGHTYDAGLVAFPDGRVVCFDQAGRDKNGGAEQLSIRYDNERLKVWAADIRFVIDQLPRYNRESDFGAPFVGHLDLRRIGALGHSDGGRAAALACQTDERVRACLNMDGVADNWPFYRDVKGGTMKQPFLLFDRPNNRENLTEKDATEMGYTLPELRRLVAGIDRKQTDLLTGMPAGAYRVTVSTPGVSHGSFCDSPLIDAADDPAQYENQIRALKIIRDYSRAFFDEALGGRKGGLLDRKSSSGPGIKVEWFPAGKVAVKR